MRPTVVRDHPDKCPICAVPLSKRKKGEGDTRREILALVREHAGESGIVYCLSRKTVESTAAYLCANGVRALPYHAGLADDVSRKTQEDFRTDRCDVG